MIRARISPVWLKMLKGKVTRCCSGRGEGAEGPDQQSTTTTDLTNTHHYGKTSLVAPKNYHQDQFRRIIVDLL